jgi:DMSO/TMAO reductase YedYZ molybdopterin-dependent catalytic subunit
MATTRQLYALPTHPLPDDQPRADDWRLRVDGLVERPLRLSLAQITALEPAPFAGDFRCEEGWEVPDLRWEGATVRAILELAKPQASARWLRVGSFTVALPLSEALGSALLAYRLDGATLAAEHGAPLRLVAPGRACYFSVKWVDHLELLADEVVTTGEAIASARIGRSTAEKE